MPEATDSSSDGLDAEWRSSAGLRSQHHVAPVGRTGTKLNAVAKQMSVNNVPLYIQRGKNGLKMSALSGDLWKKTGNSFDGARYNR